MVSIYKYILLNISRENLRQLNCLNWKAVELEVIEGQGSSNLPNDVISSHFIQFGTSLIFRCGNFPH